MHTACLPAHRKIYILTLRYTVYFEIIESFGIQEFMYIPIIPLYFNSVDLAAMLESNWTHNLVFVTQIGFVIVRVPIP